jgi:hypothetical protein
MPVMPKLLIIITLGYVLSPINLIPDFIPILGYLDDLIILPALIALSLKVIPKPIMEKTGLRGLVYLQCLFPWKCIHSYIKIIPLFKYIVEIISLVKLYIFSASFRNYLSSILSI